jgi:hypothetical protein
LTANYKKSVASGLPDVQNNITVFRSFNSVSGLAGIRPSLDPLENSLAHALNAYAAARMLNDLNIVASRAMDSGVRALQTNGTGIKWDTGCDSDYDQYGVCNTWFYDGTDSFGLTDPNNMNNNYINILETLFGGVGAGPLTTGALLFSGGRDCAQSSGTNGGSPPVLDQSDPTSYSCLVEVTTSTLLSRARSTDFN